MTDAPSAPAPPVCPDRDACRPEWHRLSADAVLAELHAARTGLSEDEVAERQRVHGPNRPAQAAPVRPWLRFARQFNNVLIYLLVGAALVTFLLGHLIDTVIIVAVIVANALVGYLQEGKAERAMDAIRGMLAPQASVIRDGRRRSVPAEQLVPGDVVMLEPGDKVPADLRLLTAFGLSLQESILTGESLPVEKSTSATAADAALGDRSGMAYSGTLVAAGQGSGVVVATGNTTEIGRISGMLSSVQTLTTPLVRQMDTFARWLSLLIVLVAALLLLYGYFVAGYPFAEIFMVVVGLAVAAIPAGLPAVLTITLAIGVQAMARRHAIVRRLPSIETIGAVSVICTDKTGTLTRNEMAVASAVTACRDYHLDGVGYEPRGAVRLDGVAIEPPSDAALSALALAAARCNDAALHERGGVWTVEGDPMEGALLAFSGKVVNASEPAAWARVDAIPFDARHRYMATLDRSNDGEMRVFLKGAPERVLGMCSRQRGRDGDAPLDAAYWAARADQIAASGQRVLAVASRHMDAGAVVLSERDVEGDLTLLGLVGMIDPPRPEAVAAVAECAEAGIRVKMITGDHARTAAEIGRQIGLDAGVVLTGAELDGLDDAALRDAVMHCNVFARTSPEHKLRLVMALQAHGMTVAMTGDGVNDAPALKRADAGIAMGCKGSEAAKEASDLVLADDNFASIAAAVREGRTVYDNIKKVVSWTLPTNAGEALTIIVALVAGLSLPVTPIQILWVNMVTAITLGLALAFEPTEDGTMRRPPRTRSDTLVDGGLVWHIVLASALFLCGVFGVYDYAIARGYSIELARTMALNTLVAMEIFHLFYIRNIHGTSLTWRAVRGTPVVWATVLGVTAAQFAITYIPALQRVFDTRPVPFRDGLVIFGIGVALFAAVELEKQVRLALRRIAPSRFREAG